MTLAELHTQRGIQKGDYNGRLSIAQNLLREGLDPALVAKTTGFDFQTVKELAAAAEIQREKV
jgi:predicted transposase YdaD